MNNSGYHLSVSLSLGCDVEGIALLFRESVDQEILAVIVIINHFGALALVFTFFYSPYCYCNNIALQGPSSQQVEIITDVNDIKEPEVSPVSESSSFSSYSNKKTDEIIGRCVHDCNLQL